MKLPRMGHTHQRQSTTTKESPCIGVCTALKCWPTGRNFGECSSNRSTFFGFVEISSYWSVQFSATAGKPRMTPVSFVKTTESYEVSLAAISRQTSHDTSFLSTESYEVCRRIIVERGIIRVVHLSEWTETGGPNYHCAGQTVRAVHSFNSWL